MNADLIQNLQNQLALLNKQAEQLEQNARDLAFQMEHTKKELARAQAPDAPKKRSRAAAAAAAE